MARTALTVMLMMSMLAILGCAPWSSPTTSEYVTVASDAGNDATEARKLYDKARKEMAKHVCGDDCDLEKVEKLLQQALVADVRFGPAHHSLGVLYFWQHKLYLAAWEFEYAARLMPDRYEPLNNLGLVYESAGKFDQAKMYYSLAREHAEINAEVIGNLARVSLRSGQSVDEIRPLLDDVISTDTRPAWRRWARELLGIHPGSVLPGACDLPDVEIQDSVPTPALNGRSPAEPSSVEELPLIAPLPPDSGAASGSSDRPITEAFTLEPSLNLDLGLSIHDDLR